jgi:hypothetical protein
MEGVYWWRSAIRRIVSSPAISIAETEESGISARGGE